MTPTRTTTALLTLALFAGAASAQNYYQGQPQQYGPPQQYQGPPQQYQGPPPQGPGGWDAPPPQFIEAQRRGFRDGVDGARKDFDNHRPPNVNNRDEYRNPHFIARPDRRSYKEGFRQGYRVAVQHIYGRR